MRRLRSSNDIENLKELLDPDVSRGRPAVLSHGEERMIVERLKFAASRGSAIDADGIKHIMSRIASDGRKNWKERPLPRNWLKWQKSSPSS